jgi:hypothetical protein
MQTLIEDKQIILGLAGVARSGKDTFCQLASDILIDDYGLVSQRYALADELKNDINPFLMEKCGIDIWNCTPEQKEMVRPLLLYYGTDIKRVQSNGRCWVEKLGDTMRKDKMSDVMIVTDVRYGVNEYDELYWLREEMGGKLIYISQYTVNDFNERVYLSPPNLYEIENDPIMRKNADYHFEWPVVLNDEGEPDLTALKPMVSEFLNKIKIWN